MSNTYDWGLLRCLGVGPRHVSMYTNASRPAISMWFNNKSAPHAIFESELNKFFSAVNAAADADELPVPDSLGRAEKEHRIRSILRRYHKAAA